MQAGYDAEDFILILAEGENSQQSAPSQGDLEAYANGKGFTGPVLADPGYGFMIQFEKDNYIPTPVLLGGGLEVIKADQSVMPGDIQSAIDAL